MKRFTIALDGRAAEIVSRIPRSVRGLVLKRLIEEADDMGYFRCILLDSAEENGAGKRRKRKRKRKKTRRDVCDVSGEKMAEEVVRVKEEGEEPEKDIAGEEKESVEGPEWVREIRERIRKRVDI